MQHRAATGKKDSSRVPAATAAGILQVQPRSSSSSRLGLRTVPRPAPSRASAIAPSPAPAVDPAPEEPVATRLEGDPAPVSAAPADPPAASADMWDRRRWVRAFWALALVLVGAALVREPHTSAPIASAAPGFRSYELHGYLTISAPAPSVLVSDTETIPGTDDLACWGQSQYRDIQEGTVVTVYDDRDEEVATGYLNAGRASRAALPTATMPVCWFPFAVENLPTTSSYYQVKVAQRGTIQVSNTPKGGVLKAFPTLDATDQILPGKPGDPGMEPLPDPQLPHTPR